MIEVLVQPRKELLQERGRIPKLGFAGVGWIGRNRLEAIGKSGTGSVGAIMDADTHLATELASSIGNCRPVATFEDLLNVDLDGIVIATPSALHATQAISALEAGFPVFCQKPLGRTGPETASVVNAAKAANRLLGVDFSYRFNSGMVAIRDLIGTGALGDIYAIQAIFHNAYGPDKPWFYQPSAAGGGCLLDLGIHLVDLILWSLDFPVVETAAGIIRKKGTPDFDPSVEVEDYASGSLELSTGTAVQLACSWGAPAGCEARIELNFFGTRGGASFNNVGGSFYDFTAEHLLPDRSRKSLAKPPDEWSGRATIDWVRRLSLSPDYDPAVATVTNVATTLDRLYARSS